MTDVTFPDYAIKYTDFARKTLLALPLTLRRVADEIEADLATDPDKYPGRLIPASTAGTTYVYRHPETRLEITFEVDRVKKILYFFHYSAPTVQQTIFISYSHADREWLQTFRDFFKILEQQGLIKFWDDGQLVKGVPWEQQIKSVLDTAKAGLFLVSQNFLISQFVKDVELPKLLAAATRAGKKIYWVPLSPSTVFVTHKEITQYQSLLDDPNTSFEELDQVKRKKALVEMTKVLMGDAGLN